MQSAGGDNLPAGPLREADRGRGLWVQFVLAETLLLAEVADNYLQLSYCKANFC